MHGCSTITQQSAQADKPGTQSRAPKTSRSAMAAASRRCQQKALALLCACLLLAGAAPASGGRVDVEDMLMLDRFRSWQATYNRSYGTAAERLRRFEVYRQNMELIEATNRRGLPYQLGETPFTDLTSEEFLATHTMQRRRAPDAGAALHRELITTRAGPVSDGGDHWNYWNDTANDLDVPDSVDWRTKGAVTPVKNQGSCGSCWAFATAASIEGLHKIRTGQLVSLSEQEVVDCASPPNAGCDGGDPGLAMDWVAANGGITTESDYPYEGKQGKCKADKARNHAVKIRGRQSVNSDSEAALEVAVARQPVAVSINADPIKQHYRGGVFNGPCDPKNLNHAVTVVGYGAESGGRKYWIVKNSWGDWGEKGYFRLERRVKDARGTCGIAVEARYPVM